MRKFSFAVNIVLSFLLCFILTVKTKAQVFSNFEKDSLVVSVLTCAPGNEVYQFYGHTAIMVENLSQPNSEKVVFNYGLFDFRSPNFVWRFLLGDTDYLCGATSLDLFLRDYIRRGSAIQQSVLNLKQAEARKLTQALLTNCMLENATYHYDFFYDNCATRPRDKIIENLDGRLEFVSPIKKQSIRDIVHEYSAKSPWALFGQDLLLGAEADVEATRESQQFAPLYLDRDLKNAFVVDSVGNMRPLVRETKDLLMQRESESIPDLSPFDITPMMAMLILLGMAIVLIVIDLYRKKPSWWFDGSLMLIQGLAGVLICFMFFCSAHPTVDSNHLIVLFNPIPLFFIYSVMKKEIKGKPVLYFTLSKFWFLGFLCYSCFDSQQIGLEVKILALILLLRSLAYHYIIWHGSIQEKN